MGEVVSFYREELQVVEAKEAAKLLGISSSTLTRMRKLNIGPQWVKLSARRIGYQLRALRNYLEAQTAGVDRHKAAA